MDLSLQGFRDSRTSENRLRIASGLVLFFTAFGTATAQDQSCPPEGLSAGEPVTGGNVCLDDEADWLARSQAPGVFYANNFDYQTRDEYINASHSRQYSQADNGAFKLDLETGIKLTGNGASRHNWIAAEGANERGPAWNFSFDGPGAQTTNTRKTEFYLQYSMYVDQGYVDFTYTDGGIKSLIIYNPAVAPFSAGEIVLTRRGRGPWPSGFYVTNTSRGFQLIWSEPNFVNGDDTYYTFWDGGPQSEGGETDATSRDLFERRWGVRRRSQDRTDPDYANIPQFEGGKWFTFTTYVNVEGGNSVIKVWFAERGEPPILLYGGIDTGIPSNNNTYRVAHLISRAENTTRWINEDTFIVFDEVIVSDNPIDFPGGYALPYAGTETPPSWPPAGARFR